MHTVQQHRQGVVLQLCCSRLAVEQQPGWQLAFTPCQRQPAWLSALEGDKQQKWCSTMCASKQPNTRVCWRLPPLHGLSVCYRLLHGLLSPFAWMTLM